MRKVNHGTITRTLSWIEILPLNGFNLIGAKQRLYRRRKRVYENSPNRCKKKKKKTIVIYADISSEPGKSCEALI